MTAARGTVVSPRPRLRAERPGFSLVEALVALVLVGIVSTALVGLLNGFNRLATVHGQRIEAAETLRIGLMVLARELRWLEPERDLHSVARDSLVLRAFRGAGVVCGVSGSEVFVRYRGVRAPNPDKDSLVVPSWAGTERALPLEASRRAPGACTAIAPDESVLAWTVPAALAAGSPVFVYERGSYHLHGHALRYRRGRGGRQPLTAERLDAQRSEFRLLDLAAAERPAAVAVRLRLRDGRARASVRLRDQLHAGRVFLRNQTFVERAEPVEVAGGH